MARLTAVTTLLLFLAACQQVPPYTVEGDVTDADGNGVGGVEIFAGGTTNTAMTDPSGHFSITLDDAPNLVSARKLGWEFTGVQSGQPAERVEAPQGTPRTVTIAFTGVLAPRGKIVFSSDRDGGDHDIYLMDGDGSDVTRLTMSGGTNPSLRPDSQMVVYQQHNQLAKVPASGGTPSVFADDCEEPRIVGGNDLRRRYVNSQAGFCFLMAPAYNQGGTRIAYWWEPLSAAIELPGVPNLFVMDANGSNKEWVLPDDDAARVRVRNTPPTWSPSDTLLAFMTHRAGSGDVVLTDLDGNVSTRFQGDSREGNPAFVPGEEVVYMNSNTDIGGDPSQNLWHFAVNSFSINRRIGAPGAADTNPTISPRGGGLIAFVSDRDGDKEIYVTDRDGYGLLQLTDNTAEDDSPDWK